MIRTAFQGCALWLLLLDLFGLLFKVFARASHYPNHPANCDGNAYDHANNCPKWAGAEVSIKRKAYKQGNSQNHNCQHAHLRHHRG